MSDDLGYADMLDLLTRKAEQAYDRTVWASADYHERSIVRAPDKRRKCWQDECGGRATHFGVANGVVLMAGCEWSVRRWVRAVK